MSCKPCPLRELQHISHSPCTICTSWVLHFLGQLIIIAAITPPPPSLLTTHPPQEIRNNSTITQSFHFMFFPPKNKKHQKIQYNFLPYTHTCVKLTLKLLPPAGSQNNHQQHTPSSPVPTQWYNGQETNDEIRYFRTPINNDFKLQEITNEIIRLKVVQFHTSQRIEYLDWCNKNEICPNDFTITIMTPEFNDLGFKHQKHCMEVMETSIKRYTEIHIAHNQEQHNYANFQIQQKTPSYSGPPLKLQLILSRNFPTRKPTKFQKTI